jgi:hypothetical protein
MLVDEALHIIRRHLLQIEHYPLSILARTSLIRNTSLKRVVSAYDLAKGLASDASLI